MKFIEGFGTGNMHIFFFGGWVKFSIAARIFLLALWNLLGKMKSNGQRAWKPAVWQTNMAINNPPF